MGHRVAIIGAGLAGLAAGHRLRAAGLNPVVFEAEDFIGGRSASEEVQGFIIDRGAYTWPQAHRRLTRVAADLGLADGLRPTPGTSSTFSRGREHQVKVGSIKDFLGFRLLPFRNKLDLIGLFLKARRLGPALNPAAPTARTLELETETAAAVLRRHYDETLLETVAYPIFSEIFLGEPETNSWLAFLATIKNLTWFTICALDGGMGALADRLAQDLDVRLGTPVRRISARSETGPVEVELGGGGIEICDAVIVTVPAPLAPGLYPDCPRPVKDLLGRVAYAPSIVVALALDRPWPGHSYLNNLLRREFQVVATVVLDHHKGPGRCPPDKGLVTAVLSAPAARKLLEAPEETIVQAVLSEIERLWPGFSSRVLFARVYCWPCGAVQLGPGAVAERRRLTEELDRLPGPVYFAGDGLLKSSLEISYNSGVGAAERWLARGRPAGDGR
jgi:oxygen-dependent protoporphyrinogen oxidase